MSKKDKGFIGPAVKKISAEMRAKPIFDAKSVSTLDGGTVYPVGKSEWVVSGTGTGSWIDWSTSVISSTSSILTGSTITATSPGSYKLTGTFTGTGTLTSVSPWFEVGLPKWQRDIILDVICEEIVSR